MVDAVGRNRSGRWEDHLWTGRDRGEREGEKKGKRGRRERGRRKEGGILRNMVTFVAGLCKLVQYWHGLLNVPAKTNLPNAKSCKLVATPGTLAWLVLHPS